MKALLAVCMIATGTFAWASEVATPNPREVGLERGKVVEIRNAEHYTYLGLRTADGESWPHAIPVTLTDSVDARVPKALGANAWTVADIVKRRTELEGKTVLVRGRVVKYNPEILGRNWVHLRDGTGSALDNTNDILVTTADDARPGDIVTAKGIVRVDQDFGAGYTYRVLIEEATLQPQPATR